MATSSRLALLLLIVICLAFIVPIFGRRLKEEIAGNLIQCKNVRAGFLDYSLLRRAFQVNETLYGYVISKSTAQPFDATITVRLVRDLSTDIAGAALGMGMLKNNVRRFFSMYPSIIWCANRWHTITRLTDEGGPRWKLSNYLITHTFDEKFDAVCPPRLLGLPTFLNGVPAAGLEDPRLIVRDQKLFIQGNVHYLDLDSGHDLCRVGLFSAATSAGVLLDVPGHELYRWEKSWTGFVKDGSLRYLYSLHPLVELQCKDNGDCAVVYHQELCGTPPCDGVSPRGAESQASFLRGGSSLVPWNSFDDDAPAAYYVGFAHTNIQGEHWVEATEGLSVKPLPLDVGWHKSHLIVYNADDHRIVYVSSPITLGQEIINMIGSKYLGIVEDPSSFVITGDGRFVMGINLDDSHPVITVVDGLVPVIEEVIRRDQSQTGPTAGDGDGAADGLATTQVVDPDLLRCTMHAARKHLRDNFGR